MPPAGTADHGAFQLADYRPDAPFCGDHRPARPDTGCARAFRHSGGLAFWPLPAATKMPTRARMRYETFAASADQSKAQTSKLAAAATPGCQAGGRVALTSA